MQLSQTAAGQGQPSASPRLLVLTDITSLQAGVREPDDGQSLVRLLLYSNEIEIEGLVASSNLGHGQVCRPELIEAVVRAYAAVRPSLLGHDPAYPPAEDLLGRIRAGQPAALPNAPVDESIGPGRDTSASDFIARCALREDPRPLWVAVWGGTADLAQALWRLHQDLPSPQFDAVLARLRVHAVGDQDSTGPWIKASFPGLFTITRGYGVRGMYRGGDPALVSPAWVEENVRQGHGALGALYPNYDGGDIWSSRLGPVRGIKEGDTPSFLGLVRNGLNPAHLPTWGGWGGRCAAQQGAPLRFVDAVDASLPDAAADPKPEMAAVHRWRPAFQNDFAARLDWCVRPYSAANHAPRPALRCSLPCTEQDGALWVDLPPGAVLELDASASSDPGGLPLSFEWFAYPEAGAVPCGAPLLIEGCGQPVARAGAPGISESCHAHLLLAVTNSGSPPLTAYRRVIVRAAPMKGA